MKKIIAVLFYPSYFSPIIQYVALVNTERAIFEVEDNYQKQTYRTRCYILGANGRQLLNIPIKNANHKQKTKEVLIESAFGWNKLHVKAIAAAYRSSPFYEYYEDDLQRLYHKPPRFLLDFNLQCQDFIFDCLQDDFIFDKTTSYTKDFQEGLDLRGLVNAKQQPVYALKPYTQVFSDKFGFTANLSIIDLLFNEGTNALLYLQSHDQSALFPASNQQYPL